MDLLPSFTFKHSRVNYTSLRCMYGQPLGHSSDTLILLSGTTGVLAVGKICSALQICDVSLEKYIMTYDVKCSNFSTIDFRL